MEALLRACGGDVSKKTVDIELFGEQKKHGPRLKISNDHVGFEKLQAWLEKQGDKQVHMCLEATGTYSDALALFLFEHGHQVSVLNPARVAAYRKSEGISTKTDAQDAMLLARFCAQKRPGLWRPTPKEVQRLQVWMGRLDDLQQMRQQERNRLENLRLDEQTQGQIQEVISMLEKQIEAVKQQAHQLISEQKELADMHGHIDSLPGIAELSAIRLLSVYHDQVRFNEAAKLVAYAGLCPAETSSGTSVHGKDSISMAGNEVVRHWLYMCALTAIRCNVDFAQWASELEARGKCKKVILVAVMRKLLHLVHGVMKSGKDYDPCKAFPSHYAPLPQAKGSIIAA